LILDSSVEDSQAEEKTPAKKKKAGGEDQRHISMEERGDAFKDHGKDEP
jgi:hypothetical protein